MATTALNQSILKVIAYFDIFNYPVNIEEIVVFLDRNCDEIALRESVLSLQQAGIIYRFHSFYSLHNDPSMAEKRIRGNKLAETRFRKARKIAAFLNWFPFTKGIAVSGSLSKNMADEESDIDFFVITAANRVWIAKFFFNLLVKMVSIIRLQKWFCINYIVDEHYLEVEEKNIFTAVEIATLYPLHGSEIFNRFFEANDWINHFLPNVRVHYGTARIYGAIFPKTIAEKIFSSKLGDRTEKFIMNFFNKRWRKLRAKNIFMDNGFQIGAMMVDSHFCRPYPAHFQQRVLNRFEEKKELVKTRLIHHSIQQPAIVIVSAT